MHRGLPAECIGIPQSTIWREYRKDDNRQEEKMMKEMSDESVMGGQRN